MKFVKREDAPTLETVKGRKGEILMAGEKCMMMVNTIEPGIPTPPHSHPHEQIGFLIEAFAPPREDYLERVKNEG